LTILRAGGEELAVWTEANGSDVEVGRERRSVVLENAEKWIGNAERRWW